MLGMRPKGIKIESDKICTKVSNEHGYIIVFKPYPPYYVSLGKYHITVNGSSDSESLYQSIKLLNQFVKQEEENGKTKNRSNA